jgi:hypothetical protein
MFVVDIDRLQSSKNTWNTKNLFFDTFVTLAIYELENENGVKLKHPRAPRF